MPAVDQSRIPADEAVTTGRFTWIPWAAFVMFFLIAAAAPLPEGLSRSGAYALAALASAVLFWASGVQDPSLTGLLILTIISLLDVLSFSDAIAGFGTEFVWLLVVTFIVAQGMMDV
ncbi:MAG: anion permease, partial [Candidatus Omnitrophica bacterium]|nr:anion permease [Candidatus Omnitrophota bacterium]